jgi:hypothetical protein
MLIFSNNINSKKKNFNKMKRKIIKLIILFFSMIHILAAQNLKAQYKPYIGKNSMGHYYCGAAVDFPTKEIADDYGPRIHPDRPYDWHGGIDYNVAGGGGLGAFILAVSGGKLILDGVNINTKLKWIGTKSAETNFYYEHIFTDANPVGTMFYGTEVKLMDTPFNKKWAIIFKDIDQNNQPFYRAIGEENGSVTFTDELGISQKVDVKNEVNAGDPIAPLGKSAGVPHCHTQAHTVSSGDPSANDPASKNPLEFVAHDEPTYKVDFVSKSNTYGEVDFIYLGEKISPIRIRPSMVGEADGPGHKRYNKVYNIDRVKLNFGKGGVLKGTNSEGIICLGSMKGSKIEGADYANQASWNYSGVNPFAYDGTGKDHNYDDFYYINFATREHKNSPLNILFKPIFADNPENAKYNDGQYALSAEIQTVTNKKQSSSIIDITLDNFMPYVRRVIMKCEKVLPATKNSYDRYWKAEELVLSNVTDGYISEDGQNCNLPSLFEKDLGTIYITAYASEPLNELTLHIPGVTNVIKGTLSDPKTYEWKFKISGYTELKPSSTTSSEMIMIFKGNDYYKNELLDLKKMKDTGKGKKVIVPKRQAYGATSGAGNAVACWEPDALYYGQDDYHRINLKECGGTPPEGAGSKGGDECVNSDEIEIKMVPTNSNTGEIHLILPSTANTGAMKITWTKDGDDLPQFDNQFDLKGLEKGLYCFTISCECCTIDKCVEVTDCPDMLRDAINEEPCPKQHNGSITVFAANGVAPYTYQWNTGATSSTITRLPAGIYTVTITDANGCSSSHEIELLDKEVQELTVTSTISKTSACGKADGAIDIDVTGGVEPYTYEWTFPDGGTSNFEDISDLAAGIYIVTITDNLCGLAIHSFEVLDGEGGKVLSVSYKKNVFNCARVNKCNDTKGTTGSNDGEIKIHVNSSDPYTFEWHRNGWSPIFSKDKDIKGLETGYYNLIATNTKTGCVEKLTVEICCCVYAITNDGTICPLPPSNVFGYSICPANEKNNVSAVTHQATPPTGSGKNDGKINLVVTGGNPSSTYYYWEGPKGFTAATKEITGLASGDYCYTVTDGCGTFTDCITIYVCGEKPLKIETAVKKPCNLIDGDDNLTQTGSIKLTVTGGAVPYKYKWSSGETTKNITGKTIGKYCVTITDEGGCSATVCIDMVFGTATVDKTSIPCQTTKRCDGDVYETIPSEVVEKRDDPTDCRIINQYCVLTGVLIGTRFDNFVSFNVNPFNCDFIGICAGKPEGTPSTVIETGFFVPQADHFVTSPGCSTCGQCGTQDACLFSDGLHFIPGPFTANGTMPSSGSKIVATPLGVCSSGCGIAVFCNDFTMPAGFICRPCGGAIEELTVSSLDILNVGDMISSLIRDSTITEKTQVLIPDGINANSSITEFNNAHNRIRETKDQKEFLFRLLDMKEYKERPCEDICTGHGIIDGKQQHKPNLATSAPKADESSINIFPNPTEGVLNVEIPYKLYPKSSIEITNMLGQVLYHKDCSDESKIKIDLSKFVAGAYHIFVKDCNNQQIFTKVIIKD